MRFSYDNIKIIPTTLHCLLVHTCTNWIAFVMLVGVFFMEQEIWKDIPGYDGIYQVSTFGNVRSFYGNPNKHQKRYVIKKPHTLKFRLTKCGYFDVCLRFNYKQKNIRVHRLVGLVFIPNPKNKPQLNHKDGNKKNNRKDNLEWNTASENTQHAFDNNLNWNVINAAKKTIRINSKLVLNRETGIFYDSAGKAALAHGLNRNILINKLNGNSHNNTVFIYA